MKTTKFLKAASLLLILVVAISCRSSRSTTVREYPGNSTTTTETSINTYPAQTNSGNLPPGQAKKIYGSQSAKAYAPGQRKKYPLVIVYTNEIVINRYSDGRYYYRNNAGYTYWKGNDGRYYLDEKHLKDIEYEEGEYDDWKFKGQRNNNAQQPKGKLQGETVKEDHKTKDAEDIAKIKEQNGIGQNQKGKGNDQKGKVQFDQKEKGNDQKGKDQSDQKEKGNDQKGKDQSDQKEKGNDQKGKDQSDQKEKSNDQKGKDQSDQKEKSNDQKGKDQADQKAKEDNSSKGKAKSKDKA